MKKISDILKEANPYLRTPNVPQTSQEKQVPEPVHGEKVKFTTSAKVSKLVLQGKKLYVYCPVLSAFVQFKNGKKCKFYSYEMRTTISQIRFRDFHPVIDLDYGYQALISMVEEKLKGQYTSALLYKNKKADENGTLCRQYKNGELLKMEDPDFNTFQAKQWVRRREDFIKLEVMNCDICIDYSQRKGEMFF